MEIIEDYYFFVVLFIMGIIFTIFMIRGKKALIIFPELNSVDILYRDKHASGYSTKSLITKMGGANKVLDLVITNTELWIRSNRLFASISLRYDLLHKIPFDRIEKAEKMGAKIV